jgi:SAM-dependent methyltransferase
MSKEFQSAQYDDIYASGGVGGIYDLPYRHSAYFPLFDAVHRVLKSHGATSVLEVGCGSGAFAHMLRDRSPAVRYRGFDFSPVAVQRAARRLGTGEPFFVGDARLESSYGTPTDAIVCTEVLEHIDADLEVMDQWWPGTFCVCSVPNFDADNHVRFFRNEHEVMARYGEKIDIQEVVRINKPFLPDISLRNTLRHLWWNRTRLGRAMAIMGWASFDEAGGWFVFAGRRKPPRALPASAVHGHR